MSVARLITRHSEYGSLFPPDFYIRSEHFVAAVQRSDDEIALGITIGRKVGRACRRNKLRRRIKSWFAQASGLPVGYKLNLIARPGAGELSWQQLCLQLQEISLRLSEL